MTLADDPRWHRPHTTEGMPDTPWANADLETLDDVAGYLTEIGVTIIDEPDTGGMPHRPAPPRPTHPGVDLDEVLA